MSLQQHSGNIVICNDSHSGNTYGYCLSCLCFRSWLCDIISAASIFLFGSLFYTSAEWVHDSCSKQPYQATDENTAEVITGRAVCSFTSSGFVPSTEITLQEQLGSTPSRPPHIQNQMVPKCKNWALLYSKNSKS